MIQILVTQDSGRELPNLRVTQKISGSSRVIHHPTSMAVDGHDVENHCSSCCSSCLSSSPSIDGAAATPFSLKNLLAAGTVFLPTPNSEDALKDRETRCSHIHAEDGWHVLVNVVWPSSLAMEIHFLVIHDFIRATYRCVNDGVILRIYAVPFDLPHVKGRLRVRKENIVSPARGYLRTLFSQVNTDSRVWEGVRIAAASHTKAFLGPANVAFHLFLLLVY